NQGTSSWINVRHAAGILWRASESSDMSTLLPALKAHYSDPILKMVDLYTGMNNSRRGVVVRTK
ncbi:hypothetical protein T440DRAFT_409846, partial [Plenodomus tracheiphilus IPT5]